MDARKNVTFTMDEIKELSLQLAKTFKNFRINCRLPSVVRNIYC